MKLAIKNPAPEGPQQRSWGDYHFGLSLQQALQEHGVEVVQHYWPNWDVDEGEDVILVLRGKRIYCPPREKLSIVWVISHPATVSVEEIDSFTLAYVASSTHQRLLAGKTSTPVEVMCQCVDTTLFTLPDKSVIEDAALRDGVIFVANSRGVRRDMLQWALDAGHPPTVFGGNWEKLGLGGLVQRVHIENRELPELYRSAGLSLNDHWADMRHFGIVNNRVFDCLASGLPVLTDDFPEVRAVLGDSGLYASNAVEYQNAMRFYRENYPELLARVRERWAELASSYSFSARAAQIVRQATHLPSRRKRTIPANADPDLTALRMLLSALVDERQSAHARKRLKLLHFNPNSAASRELAADARFYHFSAGFGDGPWQVALDVRFSQLESGGFDLVLIDGVGALERIPELERTGFVRGLVRALSVHGRVGLPLQGCGCEFRQVMEWVDLECVRVTEDFAILRRRPGTIILKEYEELARNLIKYERHCNKLEEKLKQAQRRPILSRFRKLFARIYKSAKP